VENVLRKPELCDETRVEGSNDPTRRMEAMLKKLQVLKDRISELRAHCEEIQRLHEEEKNGIHRCDECGESIELGQEVEAKNFDCKAHYYHKKCFRKLWSQ
jgi:hypothetical protein